MDDRKKETILFVDDEESILDVASQFFKRRGYQTFTACNGVEALKIIENESVDCCFTDINMPDINGLELVSFVKGNAAYCSIPLIIVSTESSDRDREKGLGLGAVVGGPHNESILRKAVGIQGVQHLEDLPVHLFAQIGVKASMGALLPARPGFAKRHVDKAPD